MPLAIYNSMLRGTLGSPGTYLGIDTCADSRWDITGALGAWQSSCLCSFNVVLLLSRLRAVAFGIYEIFGNCALARSLATQLCRSSLCVVVVAVAIMLLVLLGLSANWSIKYALKHVHHLWSRVVSCIVIPSLSAFATAADWQLALPQQCCCCCSQPLLMLLFAVLI